eukprot:GHVR01047193.1.p1 GENE.GHVR01047193.1~~GHVR01047193.1.p1  ORF type:complete len:233 (+),score=67.01 GHVR01047193.1:48-746(+)
MNSNNSNINNITNENNANTDEIPRYCGDRDVNYHRLRRIFLYLIYSDDIILNKGGLCNNNNNINNNINNNNDTESERFFQWAQSGEFTIFNQWSADDLDGLLESLPKLVKKQTEIINNALENNFMVFYRRRDCSPVPTGISQQSLDIGGRGKSESKVLGVLVDGSYPQRTIWIKEHSEEQGGQASVFQGAMLPPPPLLILITPSVLTMVKVVLLYIGFMPAGRFAVLALRNT